MSFDLDVRLQKSGHQKTKVVGSFRYDDPATPLSFNSSKFTSLTFNGNQAHFTGTGRIGKSRVSFTVDVTANGTPGTLDTFSIQFSTGYSASGNLTSGDLTIR